MGENLDRYKATKDTTFAAGDVDLVKEVHRWPDGRRMTEANTEDFTEEIAAEARGVGRPSLGTSGSSPHVAFRISPQTREQAERIAHAEGRTVSAVAREALEKYVASH